MKRAVFLDRDGTINHDPGYISDPAQMHLLDGAGEALAILKAKGFDLIVVSNQSGVGRGIIQPGALTQIHARLDELLAPWSVSIDRYEFCVHRPEEGCLCRKPLPKLLHDGAAARGVDLARSYMVGDKGSDLGAGTAAGCLGSVLVRTGYGADTERGDLAQGRVQAAFVADSLREAAQWIVGQ